MTKEDFERQINATIPRPDPEITAALFKFGQELGLEGECFNAHALLTSLQFIARNFSERTLQSAYEIISYGSAALPDEMVAAAVYLGFGAFCFLPLILGVAEKAAMKRAQSSVGREMGVTYRKIYEDLEREGGVGAWTL